MTLVPILMAPGFATTATREKRNANSTAIESILDSGCSLFKGLAKESVNEILMVAVTDAFGAESGYQHRMLGDIGHNSPFLQTTHYWRRTDK